jgi:hypothetical protein
VVTLHCSPVCLFSIRRVGLVLDRVDVVGCDYHDDGRLRYESRESDLSLTHYSSTLARAASLCLDIIDTLSSQILARHPSLFVFAQATSPLRRSRANLSAYFVRVLAWCFWPFLRAYLYPVGYGRVRCC